MPYLPRALESEVSRAARAFPAVLLTGPRRAGKTTLLRELYPRAEHRLLEDPDVLSRVRADPRGFLAELSRPAILDEVQNAPELLPYLRTLIDERPSRMGDWLITGSQEAPLMRGVSESMAGRAAVLQLLPLSIRESPKVSLFRGGFPEVLARPGAADLWFRSYVQTYLERDVRQVTAVRDLATFRRLLALLATRVGQTLNKTELAAPLGVSVPTISEWISVLEITGQVMLVPPYHENYGKRIVKTPKLYFVDTGLACHLLGLRTLADLRRSPFLGPMFECFVAGELAKLQINAGQRREIYYFRDQQGLKVDFLLRARDGRVDLIEAKAGSTVHANAANSLVRLATAMGDAAGRRIIVHGGPAGTVTRAGHGVRVLDVTKLLTTLDPRGTR